MKLTVITGPTGSGKTDLALRVARALKLPLVNADAYQLYREIPVLSNQPNIDELQGLSTHLLATESLVHPLNAGDFARRAEEYLNRAGVWVGTGMYLGAALYGLDSDRKKGTPFQSHPRVSFEMMVLNPPRQELYDSLNKRVDQMLSSGAFQEAQKVFNLLQSGELKPENHVLKAIGLQHLLRVCQKELSLEDAVSLWKRDTRRLAKRQWTWLRKFCPPSSTCHWGERKDFEKSQSLS